MWDPLKGRIFSGKEELEPLITHKREGPLFKEKGPKKKSLGVPSQGKAKERKLSQALLKEGGPKGSVKKAEE